MSESLRKDRDSDLLVHYEAGAIVFAEGDPGEEMFLIEEGKVEIVKGPSQRRLAMLEVGDFFGETSMLEDTPRMATARTATACRLLPIDLAAFDHLLRRHPEITVRMLCKLSRRLREVDEATYRANEVAAGALRASSSRRMEPVVPASRTNAVPSDTAEPDKSASAASSEKSTSISSLISGSEALLPETRPGPPARVVARLLHLESGEDFAIVLDRKNLVGRHDPVTGKYPDIDLGPLDTNRACSRRHASIWAADGRFNLREEAGVANGTVLRGQRLDAGNRYELEDGDGVVFGDVGLIFRVGSKT